MDSNFMSVIKRDQTLMTVFAFDWLEVTGWTSFLVLRPGAPCPCIHEEETKR